MILILYTYYQIPIIYWVFDSSRGIWEWLPWWNLSCWVDDLGIHGVRCSCQMMDLKVERGWETYLPHRAEYLTLIRISVGSTILGIGRSSMTTFKAPLKTTAFIVSFDMMAVVGKTFWGSSLGIRRSASHNRFWRRSLKLVKQIILRRRCPRVKSITQR